MRVCPVCFKLYGPDQTVCTEDQSPTQNHVDALVGMKLGPYIVRSLIGEGGMGVVYAGEHPTLGRRVALKVLRPELSLRDDLVDRFIQEARAVSTIGHVNIVNIYDFGKTPFGTFYIVMEYLDGQTLRQMIEVGGPQPLERVRAVVLGIGAALAAAHAKGFIHRDIKPENIMVMSRKGQESVKLLDFGIVKLLGGNDMENKTQFGTAMGTPQYMCPEQLEEAALDPRTDIYALGAVAYEMLTGRVPYLGKSHAEVRQLQLTTPPAPPSTIRQESHLSRSLDAAILWALHLEPQNRCSRMEDFLSTFKTGYEKTLQERQLKKKTTAAPEKSIYSVSQTTVSQRRLWLLISVGVVFAAILGTIVFLHYRRWQSQRQVTTATQSASLPEAQAASVHQPINTKSLTPHQIQTKVQELVEQSWTSPNANTRILILNYIEMIGRPVMTSRLRQMLDDRDPNVARAAARALGQIKDEDSIGSLRKILRTSVGYKAIDVAMALAMVGDQNGLNYLHKELAKPRDEINKKYILKQLGLLRDKEALGWKDLLSNNRLLSVNAKQEALGFLAAVGDRQAHEQLEQLVSSNDWNTKYQAAKALSLAEPEMIRRMFVESLEQLSQSEKIDAALLLAELGEEKAIPVLNEAAASKDSELKKNVAISLGRFTNPTAKIGLVLLLGDNDREVALAAAVGLLPNNTT